MTLDMRSRIRPADWCAFVRSLPGYRAVGPEFSTRMDVFVNMRINRRLRELLDVMCSDVCDRSKDL